MARRPRVRAACAALLALGLAGGCQLSEITVGSDGSSVTMAGGTGGPDASGPEAHAACRALLETQVAAWNRGDLDAFTEGYARSEQLVFATVDATHVGFEDMVARYRAAYPDRAAMGTLGFSHLSFSDLDPEHVAARGAWRLERAEDAPRGTFLLVFRRLPEGWRIVLDYTTSADA